MTYPGDMRSAALADILAYCQKATAQDCIATLQSLSQLLQIDVLRLLRLPVEAPYVSGPDAAGALITGNPMLMGGKNGTLLQPFSSDPAGNMQAVIKAINDLGNAATLSSDRAGILAVGPPVSKLFSLGTQASATQAPTLTQAAPGAGLRLCILSWGFAVSTIGSALISTVVATGGSVPPPLAVACPANDSRSWVLNGPFLLPANTGLTITGPATPTSAVETLWINGYVAAFP